MGRSRIVDSDVLGSSLYGEHAEHGCWKMKAFHVFGGVPREFKVLPICFAKQAKFSSKFGGVPNPGQGSRKTRTFPSVGALAFEQPFRRRFLHDRQVDNLWHVGALPITVLFEERHIGVPHSLGISGVARWTGTPTIRMTRLVPGSEESVFAGIFRIR